MRPLALLTDCLLAIFHHRRSSFVVAMEKFVLAAGTFTNCSKCLTPLNFAAEVSKTLAFVAVNLMTAAPDRAVSATSLPLFSFPGKGCSFPFSRPYLNL
jgi:hypothetical protein